MKLHSLCHFINTLFLAGQGIADPVRSSGAGYSYLLLYIVTLINEYMRRGSVKFYLKDRAFGFIRDLKSGFDYYFQTSDLLDVNIKSGTHVFFEITKGKKGDKASCICKVKENENLL